MFSESLPEPVQQLDTELSRLLPRLARNRARIVSLALECCDRLQIRNIVEAICEDERLLARCASRSLAHPLGFDKFTLMTSELYQVRLHIWWPNEGRGREDIHNHRFSFVSAVILGQVEVTIYDLAKPGTVMMQYREHRRRGGASYQYVQMDSVQVQVASAFSLAPGSAYYLRSSALHCVDVLTGTMAATLFVRIPRLATSTTVLVRSGEREPLAGVRRTFDLEEARERLEMFATVLAS